MATCFLNNVYCCYLPAHCSHGLQPLDNGPFNALKGLTHFITIQLVTNCAYA